MSNSHKQDRAWPTTHFGKLFDILIFFIASLPPFELLKFAYENQLIFHRYWGPIFFLLSWIIYAFSMMVIIVFLKFLLLKKIHPGTYQFGSKEVKLYGLYLLLSGFPNRSFLRNWLSCFIFPGAYFYKFMGARMQEPPIIGIDAKILDPWCLEIGKAVIIGENSVLCGHFLQEKSLVVGKIQIGDNVTIGAGSFISPKVQIGKNSTIATGAVVLSGTVIGENEKWGGVPARKLSSKH